MKTNGSRYRILVFGGILLIVFLFRILYPSLKNAGHSSPATDKVFNRNISHLVLTEHARCRMKCRDITEAEIEEILHEGNINYQKSNMNDDRGPSFALEGYTREKQHLRVVFAPKKTETVVVTCIDLDKEWQCDCN